MTSRLLNLRGVGWQRKTECTGINDPCISFRSVTFADDELVLNNNGNTIHTNVSQIYVALQAISYFLKAKS
jgi:hypothetical protein